MAQTMYAHMNKWIQKSQKTKIKIYTDPLLKKETIRDIIDVTLSCCREFTFYHTAWECRFLHKTTF
jgi:hypothetical protein